MEKEGRMEEKLSHEEFVKKAIVSLRKDGYKGIHTVYSGFNNAFKKYFEGEDPVKVTNQLAQEGKIVIRPVKGGVMLYLPEDVDKPKDIGDEALKKMGLE
jgi:predicted membrane protein